MAKTRKFQRDRARLVITLDIQVPPATLAALPSHRRDAMSLLRSMIEGATAGDPMIMVRTLRKTPKVIVLEEKMEVAS